MTNEEARTLLSEFADASSNAVKAAAWAEAFLLEGGEPTWDAIKSVSAIAEDVHNLAAQVVELREDYEEIYP